MKIDFFSLSAIDREGKALRDRLKLYSHFWSFLLCTVGVRLKLHLRGWRSWRGTWARKSRSWRSESVVWRCGSANSSNSPTARWVPRYLLFTLFHLGPPAPRTAVTHRQVVTSSSASLCTRVFPGFHAHIKRRTEFFLIFLWGEVEMGNQWNESKKRGMRRRGKHIMRTLWVVDTIGSTAFICGVVHGWRICSGLSAFSLFTVLLFSFVALQCFVHVDVQ